MKRYKARQFDKLLQVNGFQKVRSNGSHRIYKDIIGRTITIPWGKEISAVITRRLIKENNLEVE